jgi:acyl-CoA synthetase (AMP-forming)/AMP-acid ligase II
MAEATLMVSGWPLELAPKTVCFDKRALWTGVAKPLPAGHEHARPYVSCGAPMQEHEIAIVDPQTRARRADRHEGEIWLRGPSVGHGYWGDAQTSAERFAATISGEHEPSVGWFRTGDTGFIHAGELFGTGRLADLIIVGERTLQPHDIERSISEGQAALAPDCVVFMTAHADRRPQVCLAATGRRTMPEDQRAALCQQIFERVRDEHELEIDRVLLIRQRSVAKTTSGKLRRFRYAAALRDDELDILCERGC